MNYFSKKQFFFFASLFTCVLCTVPLVQGEEAVGSLKFSSTECTALGGSAACEKDVVGDPNCKNTNQFIVGECLGTTNSYCCRTVTSTDADGNPVTASNQSDAANTFYSHWNSGKFPEKTANNGTLVAPGNLTQGQNSSAACSTIGGICVSGVCSSQNRTSANGICSNTGESCCSTQIAPACSGTCRANSCNANEALSSSQMCSGGAYQVCCMMVTPATTNPSFNYTLLEKIPGVDGTNLNLAAYLSAIYKLAIWIVGLCALFMFLIGAFMYMLSAANTSKMGSAKEIMQDALIGLVLALTSYLLLYVINPDLVNLKLPSVSMPAGAPGATTTSTPDTAKTPGGPWPDDSAIRAQLKGINFNKNNCPSEGNCETRNPVCTSVAELGAPAINGLLKLKSDCSTCNITVNAGTEWWLHGNKAKNCSTTHQKGNSVVDLNRTPDLLAYLKQSGQVVGTCGGREIYGLNGAEYWDEDNAHFHVNFAGQACRR